MFEYDGAAARRLRFEEGQRRFSQQQQIREALAADAGSQVRHLTPGQRMELCPHCKQPLVDRDNAPRAVAIRKQLLTETALAVQGCRAPVWELIDAMLASEHDGRVKTLAKVLGYKANSLTSALTRAGLKSPGDVMRTAMLVRFWEIMQQGQARSITAAAMACGYSSPQSFHRTCQRWTGMRAGEFATSKPDKVLAWARQAMALDRPEVWKGLNLPPRHGPPRLTRALS